MAVTITLGSSTSTNVSLGDQYIDNPPTYEGWGYLNVGFAISFTPYTSFTLQTASLRLRRWGNGGVPNVSVAGTVVLTICGDNSGPFGSEIATATIDRLDITSSWSVVQFTLSTTPTLLSSKYWIKIEDVNSVYDAGADEYDTTQISSAASGSDTVYWTNTGELFPTDGWEVHEGYPRDVYGSLSGEESSSLSKPTTPSPANASGPGIDFSTRTLSWANGGGASTYTVRIGPYPLAYNVVSLSQPGTSYVIPESDIPLYKDNPIAWRVDAESDGATAEGDVWTFDPRPAKPITPTPESAASEQKLTQTFEWVDGGGAAEYDVWLGSDRILTGSDALSYLVPDTYLGYRHEYTWRVDASNVWGTTTGDDWTFTTLALDPPSPTYYYPEGNYWYSLLTTSDGWGDPPPTGTENVDYVITGNINMMSAHRKLMACAADRLWYET